MPWTHIQFCLSEGQIDYCYVKPLSYLGCLLLQKSLAYSDQYTEINCFSHQVSNLPIWGETLPLLWFCQIQWSLLYSFLISQQPLSQLTTPPGNMLSCHLWYHTCLVFLLSQPLLLSFPCCLLFHWFTSKVWSFSGLIPGELSCGFTCHPWERHLVPSSIHSTTLY